MMRQARPFALLLVTSLASGACQRAPRPLVADTDACDFCRMTVTDTRFGGELQSRAGRLYTFDAIECLTAYYIDASARGDVRHVWVADHQSRRLVPADSAVFLRGSRLRSPMARSLVAFAPGSDAASLTAKHGGTAISWPEVVALMKAEQFVPGSAPSRSASDSVVPPVQKESSIIVEATRAGAIGAALATATPGARIVVRPGVYREPTLTIRVPVTIEGNGSAILDGEGKRGLIVVAADDVTIRGLTLRNTGASQIEDRAALLVNGGRGCRIERNRIESAFFGIYLSRANDCLVAENEVSGSEQSQTVSGNGIHVWQSDRVSIVGNHVRGHRDGIYFEFVKSGTVRANTSEKSDRYGLHFMFSDDCRYEGNTFQRNGAGVAVMYSKRVRMTHNTFAWNQGGAAYGLLLKEISDSEIGDNHFRSNSVGLHLEGANRNRIAGNEFTDNGWALRVLGSAQENVVTRNSFAGNSFDVSTNSRQNYTTFRENYWDRYRGYDLDRDGFGDVAFPPVRLFAVVAEQSPATMILQRSILVDLLDLAERMLPVVTPSEMVDTRPLMRSLLGPRAAATAPARDR